MDKTTYLIVGVALGVITAGCLQKKRQEKCQAKRWREQELYKKQCVLQPYKTKKR